MGPGKQNETTARQAEAVGSPGCRPSDFSPVGTAVAITAVKILILMFCFKTSTFRVLSRGTDG